MRSDWSSLSLFDFVELKRGFDLPENKRVDGSIPIIASTAINGFHNEAKVKAPGVVIGRSGSIGGGQYIIEDFWPLNTTLWVKDFRGNDPRYTYYLMRSIDFSVFNVGSGVPTLNRNHLTSVNIKIPPLPEQRRIAALLGALDDKIELNRKMNQTLEEMAQAIFKSWFIDFDGVPEEDLVESELGLIPRGWEVGTLGDLIKFQNGYAFKSKDWQKTGVPVIKIGSVKPQIVDLNKVSFVSEQVAQKAARFRLKTGDILVGMTGYVGEVGRVPPTNTPPLLNQRVGRIVFDERQEAYEFIYCLMRNSTFKTYVENMASGSAQANVSGEAIGNYPILIPPKDVLLTFGSKSGMLMTQILTNCEINTTLAELRDTLLPKLISGELRIPEAEEHLTDALS